MGEIKPIREPKQKRSIQKKQLVIDTAKELFCKNGYHNTTTNEIAKQAGISIGTLYSYFTDKETILLELLEQYNEYFYRVFEFIDTEENTLLFKNDLRKWLYSLVDNLVKLHEPQKDFYRELESLYYSTPEVTAVMDMQNERVRLKTLELMEKYQDDISCEDIEAASVIIIEFTSALVDRIVFKDNSINRQRLIDMGVETLYKMVRA
jgi:AcrR family transcriptional regulator